MKKINKFNRLLSLVLAVLMLFTVVSCAPGGNTQDTTSGETTVPPEMTVPAEDIEIIKDGKTEYRLVYSVSNAKEVVNRVLDLHVKFSKMLDSGRMTLVTDESFEESAKEIVVGVTSRSGNDAVSKLLGQKDYGVVYHEGKVYIYAYTPEKLLLAIDLFINNYCTEDSVVVKSNTLDLVKYDYQFSTVKLNGEDIGNYKIVIPKDAGILEKYAAENLRSYLSIICGRVLSIVDDTTAETECELLIGATNRAASKAVENTTCPAGHYILYRSGKQYVMTGEGYMVGGGAGALVTKHMPGSGTIDVTDVPDQPKAVKFTFEKAENAIIMIGDGMGNNHIDATLAAGLDAFVARQLPNIGEAVTHSVSYPSPTDSAAAATALSSGYRTVNGYIGVDRYRKSQTNVREVAHEAGAKTAVITTDVITGATPGGFLVHVPDRNATSTIQAQIDQLLSEKKVDYAIGSVDDELTSNVANALYGMTAEKDNRFFAMVEAAYIDKRSHSNDMTSVVNMVKRYNDVIAYVVEFMLFHPDTVLVITADHETGGITLNRTTGRYYFTSGDHTNTNVPVFALGNGTEIFNGKVVDNIDIPKFVATIFGNTTLGN